MNRSRAFVSATLLSLLFISACGKDPEVAKREFLRSGDEYVTQKKFPEAAIEYRNAVQQDPLFGEARKKLAVVLLELGDFAGAFRESVRAADLLPEDGEAQVNAGRALLIVRDFEQARSRADKALALNPRNVDAQVLRAQAFAGLNQLSDALTDVEEAIRNAPDRIGTYALLGTMQMVRGDRREAEAAFRQAVKTAPTSINARLALANFLWAVDRRPEAEDELKQVLSLDPKNDVANRAMAIFYYASGRTKEAEPFLKAAAETAGPTNKLILADYYLATERPAESRRLLESLAASNDRSVFPAKLRLAGLNARSKDVAGAMRLVDEVLAVEASNVDALLVKAELLADAGKLDEARQTVDVAVQSNPQSAAAQYMLGMIHNARGAREDARAAFAQAVTLDPRMAKAELELAKLSMGRNDVERAEGYAQSAARKITGYVDAYLLLARINLIKGNVSRAEPQVRALARAMPASPVVQGQLGQLEMLKGNRPAARRAFEKALAANPVQLDALAGLVTMDRQDKQVASAKARLAAAVKAAPRYSHLLLLAGRGYMELGDLPLAEQTLRTAVEVDPNNLQGYSLLGQVFIRQGRIDDAVAHYTAVTKKQPGLVFAHTLLGILLQAQNKPAEARAQYELALASNPRAPLPANNLAWMLAETGGNLDVALELAQTAKAGLPNEAFVTDTLGWVYYKKGLHSLAVNTLKESVGSEPNNPVYLYHLGMAYAGLGHQENARVSLEKSLAIRSDFKGAADAKRALDSLKG